MRILVTGCAGFIGSHVSEFLLKRGDIVFGIDNLNDYYSVKKKEENLEVLYKYDNFEFAKEDICKTNKIQEFKPQVVCHLASMAGVRYSIENPKIYSRTNIEGFINIVEESLKNHVNHLVYASSSSVYGLNKKVPFSEDDKIETCNSPYACSKRAMEIYGKTYNQLYGFSNIGLRFFTVYGPRGRPDMAPYKFLKAIHDGVKFKKYGDGSSSRDYTYIDDIVQGVVGAIDNKNNIKYGIYNLGNSSPITLNEFIALCEKVSNKKAIYDQIDKQLGDVPHTYADISKAKKDLGYNPKIKLSDGLNRMTDWIKEKDFKFSEEMVYGKKHLDKLNFDKSKYNFIPFLENLFETVDLSLLHLKQNKDYEVFKKFGSDSNTEFHDKFYEYLRSVKGVEIKNLYDKFIKEVILPYLGLERALIQTFPTIRFHLPNNIAVARKHIDSEFHPIGEINFSYAYTDMYDTNTIWIEKMPRMENYVQIKQKAGECTSFNANLCTHYNKINKTNKTRVSMDFRILPLNYYNENDEKSSASTNKKYVDGDYYKMMSIN